MKPLCFDEYVKWFQGQFSVVVEDSDQGSQQESSQVGIVTEEPKVRIVCAIDTTSEGLVVETKMVDVAGDSRRSRSRTVVRNHPAKTHASSTPVIAFGKVEHLCYEDQNTCTVHVIRRGPTTDEISANWHTENYDIAAHSYKDQSGTVTIPAGEAKATFEVELISNPEWNLTSRQFVHLTKPMPASIVQLGAMCRTEVVLLDCDQWPYDENNQKDEFAMVRAFVMQMSVSLWPETWRCAVLYMYPALFWVFVQLMLNVAFTAFENRDEHALHITAGVYVVGVMLWHFDATAINNLKLGGKGKILLRRSLVQTVLTLTSRASEKTPMGAVLGVVSDQVDEVISVCWAGLLSFWGNLFQLAVMLAWTSYIVRDDLQLLGIPLCQLCLDIVILKLRLNKQVRLCTLAVQADDEWKDRLIEWTALKEMVVAYRQSMNMGSRFEDVHKVANGKRFELLQYQTSTQAILKYTHSLFIVGAYVYGGHQVLEGSYKVSSFVLLMSTVHKFDQTISTICSNAYAIINGAAPINKIASVLNATTRRKALLRAEERRHRILSTLDDPDFDPDNISMIDVAFDRGESYHMEEMVTKGVSDEVYSGERMDIVGPVSFAIPQGTVNAITGPVDAPQKLKGKKTLLMLLGRFILPTNGIVVYPPNLRVRYIPGEPLLIQGSVMDNLRFGNQTEHGDEEMLQLSSLVGLSKRLIQNPSTEVGINGNQLSTTERASICIARALLSSVDLLLLGGAFDVLTNEHAESIVRELKEWVAFRGMKCLQAENNGAPVDTKKLKTVFYVTNNSYLDDIADCRIRLAEDAASVDGVENAQAGNPDPVPIP